MLALGAILSRNSSHDDVSSLHLDSRRKCFRLLPSHGASCDVAREGLANDVSLVRLDVGDEVDEPCDLRHVVTSVDATALTFIPRPSD